jgi:hypothetical protein
MSNVHGRAPFGRLHANTIAKEGSVVSPPAKAPVNRQAGPALQARHAEACCTHRPLQHLCVCLA